MILPPLHICNRSRADRIKRRGWSGVLTLADPDQSQVLTFHSEPHPDHLVIRCEDLDEPTEGFLTPTVDHVVQILTFGRRNDGGRLLVHCNVGISRSTAATLAILADRMGPGREIDALATLIELQPEAVPNLLIVQYADELLCRAGALVRAVEEWDKPRPWNQWRRAANRLITLTGRNTRLPAMPKLDRAE